MANKKDWTTAIRERCDARIDFDANIVVDDKAGRLGTRVMNPGGDFRIRYVKEANLCRRFEGVSPTGKHSTQIELGLWTVLHAAGHNSCIGEGEYPTAALLDAAKRLKSSAIGDIHKARQLENGVGQLIRANRPELPELPGTPTNWPIRAHFFTGECGRLLAYQEQPKQVTVVTVTMWEKWYGLNLIDPYGAVTFVPFPEPEGFKASAFVDHVPNPLAVEGWAEQQGYYLDPLAQEMIIGRWKLEVGT